MPYLAISVVVDFAEHLFPNFFGNILVSSEESLQFVDRDGATFVLAL